MEISGCMLVFGTALAVLGAAILYYLATLSLNFWPEKGPRERREPDFVREINVKLISNNVETERDLI